MLFIKLTIVYCGDILKWNKTGCIFYTRDLGFNGMPQKLKALVQIQCP